MPDKLVVPPSEHNVRVRMIDSTSRFTIRAECFFQPSEPDQYFQVPNTSYLIEHEPSGRKIMFDLGVRKDYWNLPKVMLHRLSLDIIKDVRADFDLPSILTGSGVALEEICK